MLFNIFMVVAILDAMFLPLIVLYLFRRPKPTEEEQIIDAEKREEERRALERRKKLSKLWNNLENFDGTSNGQEDI